MVDDINELLQRLDAGGFKLIKDLTEDAMVEALRQYQAKEWTRVQVPFTPYDLSRIDQARNLKGASRASYLRTAGLYRSMRDLADVGQFGERALRVHRNTMGWNFANEIFEGLDKGEGEED